MSLEMALWRIDGGSPVRLPTTPMDLEQRLEDMLVEDPKLTGGDLFVIGRQVPTAHGGFIDVLALDADGTVHVLELKRDRTPRDVVAQVLDYGSWVQELTPEDLDRVFAVKNPEASLEVAFAEHFNVAMPEVINGRQQLTIVASELDPASDRIVEYLAGSYGVPINAVFFRHFEDDGREYLARTWLIDPREIEAKATRSHSKVRPWNGRDYYVVLGRVEDPHRWDLARQFGFLNAGGGSWYWKPLRNLTEGNRVFAYVGGAGYVGVGNVSGPAIPAREAKVSTPQGERSLLEMPGLSTEFRERAASIDEEVTEYVVPVEWLATRELNAAVSERGLFASQVTVCKLRDERTIAVVEDALELGSD